ncbi:hypothetical protein [Aliikangiella sp. IMCC44632]
MLHQPRKRRLLIKSLKIALAMLCLGYFLVWWQANSAVSRLVNQQNFAYSIDYQWLWIDFNADINIHGLEIVDYDLNPVLNIETLSISLDRFSDLIALEDLIVYQKLPSQFELTISHANYYPALSLEENLFAVRLPQNILPSDCREPLFAPIKPFSFDSNFRAKQLIQTNQLAFEAQLNIHNLSNISFNGALDRLDKQQSDQLSLVNFNLNIEQLTWLHHRLNQCMQSTQLSRGEIAQLFKRATNQYFESLHLIPSNELLTQLSQFLFSPQSVSFSIAPEKAYSLKQLSHLTWQNFKEKSQFKVSLNQQLISELFKDIDYKTFLKSKAKSPQQKQPKISYLAKLPSVLARFIGAEIQLHLNDKSLILGRLEGVSGSKVMVSQYQFGGRVTLPHELNQVNYIIMQNSY